MDKNKLEKFIENKTGTEMTLTTIVQFIILAIVVVVIILFFVLNFGENSTTIFDGINTSINDARNFNPNE